MVKWLRKLGDEINTNRQTETDFNQQILAQKPVQRLRQKSVITETRKEKRSSRPFINQRFRFSCALFSFFLGGILTSFRKNHELGKMKNDVTRIFKNGPERNSTGILSTNSISQWKKRISKLNIKPIQTCFPIPKALPITYVFLGNNKSL